LRILLVTDAWTPQVNGVVITLRNTIAGLQDAGHIVEIVGPDRFRSVPCPTYPEIRLALAGRAGEGEFDRVILLLDAAAKLPFAAPVKGTRQRMLEFCAALD